MRTDAILHRWFHGVLSRDEADEVLRGQQDGAYLIRVSGDRRGYSLSAKYVA